MSALKFHGNFMIILNKPNFIYINNGRKPKEFSFFDVAKTTSLTYLYADLSTNYDFLSFLLFN